MSVCLTVMLLAMAFSLFQSHTLMETCKCKHAARGTRLDDGHKHVEYKLLVYTQQ